MLIALLASSLARADELKVVLTATGHPDVEVTFNDVEPGELPSILLPSNAIAIADFSPAAGPSHLFAGPPNSLVAKGRRSPDAIRLVLDIEPVVPGGAGNGTESAAPTVRIHSQLIASTRGRDRVLLAPTVTALVGEEAMVSQGQKIPFRNADGTYGSVTGTLALKLLYTPTSASASLSAPAAVASSVQRNSEPAPDKMRVDLKVTGAPDRRGRWRAEPGGMLEFTGLVVDGHLTSGVESAAVMAAPRGERAWLAASQTNLRVEVDAGSVANGLVPLDVRVWERKGTGEHLLAEPKLLVTPGEKATFTIGSRAPVLGEDGQVASWKFSGVDLALTYQPEG